MVGDGGERRGMVEDGGVIGAIVLTEGLESFDVLVKF